MSVGPIKKKDKETGRMIPTGGYWIQVNQKLPTGRLTRHREQSTLWTKRDAKQREREIRNQITSGTYKGKEERKQIPTLEKFSEEFMKNYAAVNNKPSEVLSKQSRLDNHLIPKFGRVRIDEIKAREVADFRSDLLLKQNLKPGTVNNILTVLKKMLDYAAEMEIIEKVPRIKLLPVDKPDFDFFTFDEAKRLLEAAKYNQEWYDMIYFAIRTGLRYGELCELRWKDIDLVEGTMRVSRNFTKGSVVTRKNRDAYTVPLSDETVRLLKRHRHLKGELVFSKPDGGRHIHRRFDVALRRICRKAGLREVGPHVLRHTFGSHLAMKGVPLLWIKELMGHKDINSTLKYAHLMPDVKREAIAVLDGPMKYLRQYYDNSEAN